ncbi:MAG: leucyl aminopeptidase [Alphaproteobacteria bacterium]
MYISFKPSKFPTAGTVCVPVFEGNKLSGPAQLINEKMGGAVARALKNAHFDGKKGEVLGLSSPAGLSLDRVILFGAGKSEDLKFQDAIEIGASLVGYFRQVPDKEALIMMEGVENETLDNAKLSAGIASGFLLRGYDFHKYRTQLKPHQKLHLENISFSVDSPKNAEAAFKIEEKVVEGVLFARDLMCEPPNILNPETYAKELKNLSKLGLKVEVLGRKDMEKMGMNALLGVAQGSAKEPQMVIMHWKGGQANEAPLAFVGKGVTFDTGGISIKPSAKMDEMKMDMGGSAAVCGLMYALAARNAKVNAVGIVGLVENMPDGNAQRPGDIVTSMSGQTIEILNTDAEGRLVLADALWYTQETFNPKLIIDLATLTGAICVSLGSKYAGLFSNDEGLVHKLRQAGEETREHVWQMPLDDRYDKDINSSIADMKNIGDNGAGSITAAQFLQRFVNKKPWAHLDIAGTAWTSESHALAGRYPIGFGVRLLNAFVHKFYESK